MQRWVARTNVIAILLLMYPHVLEYDCFHLVDRRLAILFRVAVASTPQQPVYRGDIGREMPTLLEAGLQIHLLYPLSCLVEALFRFLFLVGRGVSVHDMNVVNTVCTLFSEVRDKKVSLLFRDLWRLPY